MDQGVRPLHPLLACYSFTDLTRALSWTEITNYIGVFEH